jgi:hypothetical protein
VDWIGLARDRGKCRAFVNSVMNFYFHDKLGNYPVASQLVASRVVLSCLELVSLIIKWFQDERIGLHSFQCTKIQKL